MRPMHAMVTTIVLAAAAVAAFGGETYRNDAAHLTMTLPDGWSIAPQQALDAYNEARKKTGVQYDAGFVPQDGSSETVYVLLQVLPGPQPNTSYEDIEGRLPQVRKSFDATKENGITGISTGEVAFDRQKNRIVIRSDAQVAGREPVGMMSVAMLSKDAEVGVYFYAPAKDFDKFKPTFIAIADSAHFDDGFGFVAGTGAGGLFSGVGQAAVTGAIIGGLIGVVGWIGKKLKKKPAA